MWVYICTVCGEEFSDREKALAHRRRTQHTLKMEIESERNSGGNSSTSGGKD